MCVWAGLTGAHGCVNYVWCQGGVGGRERGAVSALQRERARKGSFLRREGGEEKEKQVTEREKEAV